MARRKTEQELELPFEEAMQRLEEVLRQLEEGDIPLEASIALYQEGIKLSRYCGKKLDAIEAQVTQLLEEEGKMVEQPFRLEEDEA
ncbi:exodeoxyribonuclease VII small subunit [Brevibacillus dissolubilis]|uniref:exodeoxyribonuclease VII small subunit n=1 Tax=Brevibacillus dissolubilis TaxID=1844116 RepID=UPI0011173836|nr:exodeoxyribonuclease VII small subunit [Brevibacillus dissolubilis]